MSTTEQLAVEHATPAGDLGLAIRVCPVHGGVLGDELFCKSCGKKLTDWKVVNTRTGRATWNVKGRDYHIEAVNEPVAPPPKARLAGGLRHFRALQEKPKMPAEPKPKADARKKRRQIAVAKFIHPRTSAEVLFLRLVEIRTKSANRQPFRILWHRFIDQGRRKKGRSHEAVAAAYDDLTAGLKGFASAKAATAKAGWKEVEVLHRRNRFVLQSIPSPDGGTAKGVWP